MKLLLAALSALLLLLLPAVATAHPGHGEPGAAKGFLGNLASQSTAPTGLAAAGLETTRPVPVTSPGPCTALAREAMPVGGDHDHKSMGQHGQRCGMEQVAFLPLKEQLRMREDVILGELDVKAGIAAVSITFPRAGILFFDVKDPTRPKFLSKYDGTECDQAVIDINCGAFVDLSADGKTAYLSVQKLSFLPGQVSTDPGAQSGPGVEVVDISEPSRPLLTQSYPIAGIGGVHTVRSHTVPEGPSSADRPRRPGEYVFSNQNGVGIDIARVRTVAGRRVLEKLPAQNPGIGAQSAATLPINEVHDTFIQDDPLDRRTYLYVAAGFDTGFLVYDVTDPERVRLVAEWDLTPECEEDWYAHTIDVAHRGGRRYVTMPAELFLQADEGSETGLNEMTQPDKDAGCGRFVGNGDKVGPLWIVDATDFARLGPADGEDAPGDRQTDAELKRNSEAALVTTWQNPAGRAAGSLTFTPHNQQVVGDRIYLSHYHGGVYVLDASAAFRGERERPRELGFIVPNGEPTRPLLGQPIGFGLAGRFFTDFPLGRSESWDAVVSDGHAFVADMTGGFYSLRYTGTGAGGPGSDAAPGAGGRTATGASCRDATAPRSTFARQRSLRLTRSRIVLTGRARDPGACRGKIRRVGVSVAREVRGGRRCRFLTGSGRFSAPRSCRRTAYLRARGTTRWRFARRARLARGRYRVRVRGIDSAGNVERTARTGNLRRLRVAR